MLRACGNSDVFNTYWNIFGVHLKSKYPLFILIRRFNGEQPQEMYNIQNLCNACRGLYNIQNLCNACRDFVHSRECNYSKIRTKVNNHRAHCLTWARNCNASLKLSKTQVKYAYFNMLNKLPGSMWYLWSNILV